MGLEQYRSDMRQRKQQAILAAALAIFLEQGYDRASLEQIARSAGVSSATLYKHFPTKSQLFGAIMAQAWTTQAIDPDLALNHLGPAAALVRIGATYADLLSQPHMLPLFRLVIAEVPRFPELGRELFSRGKEPFLHVLHRYFERQVLIGTMQIADIPLATRQFLGMINDVLFWPRFLDPALVVSPELSQQVIESAVQTFLARYMPT